MEISDDSFEENDVEATFSLVDTVKKMLEQLVEKVKCSMDAVEAVIGEGALRSVFKQFRYDVESLLKNDAKQCLHADGLIEKLK